MLLLMLSAVAAPTLPAPVPPSVGAAVKPAEKPICRAGETPIGSMLPGKRICHARADWAAIDAARQRNADVMADRDGHRATGHD